MRFGLLGAVVALVSTTVKGEEVIRDVEERPTSLVPSPVVDDVLRDHGLCRNGGTLVTVRGSNKCECPPLFSGHSCQTPRWRCRPQGPGYRCEPPPRRRVVRSRAGDGCGEEVILCGMGSSCVDGRCVCLDHFEGKYCMKPRNLCRDNPCPGRAFCEPRIGGFNCECPPDRKGTKCDIPKNPSMNSVKSPNFLYVPQQYAEIEYTYCFYAMALGLFSMMTIDFGDGTRLDRNTASFLHYHDFRVDLLRDFTPPLMVPFSNVEAVLMNHTYQKQGSYSIQVKVVDKYDEQILYDTTYDVNVEHPRFCKFSLRLQNCAQQPDMAFIYELRDDINIMADIHTLCVRAKYIFSWKVYNATSLAQNATYTDSQSVHFEDNIVTNSHILRIPQFTLTPSAYVARLWMQMTAPNQYNASATTWFVIAGSDPVPKIEGSMFMEFVWNETTVLDASVTHDINSTSKLVRRVLNSYRFYWSCKMLFKDPLPPGKEDFCAAGAPYLNETGPVLTIPPRALTQETRYTFTVAINDPNNSCSVVVSVLEPGAEVMRIHCVENCGDKLKPDEITVMRADCHRCSTSLAKHLYSWSVTRMTDNGSHIAWTLEDNQAEFGLLVDVLFVRSDVFNFSSTYLFEFKLFRTDQFDSNEVDTSGTVSTELVKSTMDLKTPLEHKCGISPVEGFSVFTSFNIKCDVSVKNTLLTYEVAQLQRTLDSREEETWVSFGTNPQMSNLRLTAGHADGDHVTKVRITISSSELNAQSQTVLSVTVLPATFYSKVPERLFREIYYQLFGAESVLAPLHASKHNYRVIQVIRVTAAEVQNLINTQYYRYLEKGPEDRKEFFADIFILREAMLEYLSQRTVYNVHEMKQLAISTTIVLRLPSRLLPSTDQVVNVIFQNILQSLKALDKRSLSRREILDLGVSVTAIGSVMLRKTKFDWKNLSEVKYDMDENETIHWTTKNMLWSEKICATLQNLNANVTQSILDLSSYLLKYLPINGPGLSIIEDGIALTVQKGTLKQVETSFEYMRGLLKPTIKEEYLHNIFIVSLLQVDFNPYWWVDSLRNNIFPFISIEVNFDDIEKTTFPLGGRIELDPLLDAPEVPLINGKLKVVPFWMLDESHIEVYRFTVHQVGKIALFFTPLEEKIQIVIKKESRPMLHDFWNDAITLPAADGKHGNLGSKRLVVMESMKVEQGEFVYVGVLPHVETLRKLIESDHKTYHFRTPDVVSEEGNPTREDEFADVLHVRQGDARNNSTLPFAFSLQIVNCYNFNQVTLELEDTCFVSKSESFTLACTCKQIRVPIFKMNGVLGQRSIFTDTMFSITAKENPVILIVMFYMISIFLGLFMWARLADREDRTKKGVIYLRDNDPTHGYTYVLMVFTSCRPRAGTSSRVAVQLVGADATSAVHVLEDRRRAVLTRASQEWFVLKTARSLGDLAWINLWHDHTGARPAWHCDKVLVHDVRTREVWVFAASQWLAPLHGDGTMSCSVDRTLDLALFEKRFRFGEYFARGCDVGHHGWLAAALKRTGGGCFTRRQRVGATLAYAAVIVGVVAHVYAVPVDVGAAAQLGGKAAHAWSYNDVVNGVYAALVAAPVYFALYWLFHCIEPDASPDDEDDFYPSRSFVVNLRAEPSDSRMPQNDDGDSRTKLPYTIHKEGARAKRAATTPMQGERIVDEVFCLPAWTVYIAWSLIIIIVATCIYVSTFQGIMLNHVQSICFLISLGSAILASMLLETVKVALIALFYSLCTKTLVMTVKDRSEYVRHLNQVNEEKDERVVSQRLAELRALRRKPMYKPIPHERVQLLRKTAISEATARHVVGDLSLFLLFSVIIVCILYSIRHPNQYAFVQSVKNLVHSGSTDGLYHINNQHKFVSYIKRKVIPNIFTEFELSENPQEEEKVTYLSNYLIGVPRLRQIRRVKGSCSAIRKWHLHSASQCSPSHLWIEGDTEDYGPFWTARRGGNNSHHGIWSHRSAWSLQTPPTAGNMSTYAGGGYAALLARTANKSLASLGRLVDTQWHDALTAALFLELAVYNADLGVGAMVTLLGERSLAGSYHVATGVAAVRLDPAGGSAAKLVALATLVALAAVVVTRMRAESNRIARLAATRYTGGAWFALRVCAVALGVAAAALFAVWTRAAATPLRKLRAPETDQFVSFHGLAYWADLLTAVLALLFFLVVLDLWHVLSYYFRFQVMITTLHLASYPLLCYLVILSVFLIAFVCVGHLLLAPSSYTFRTVWSSFLALCSFYQQDLFRDAPYNTFQSSVACCKVGLYFAFFACYMFGFRWGFALVLMGKYKRVVTFARDAWLHPILDEHVRARLASRPFLRAQRMTREYVLALTALFRGAASDRLAPARYLAMRRIVGRFRARQPDDPEFLSEAKCLAMAALVVSQMSQSEPSAAALARANPLVGAYLRMAQLRDKIQKLDQLVTELLEKDEL